MTINADIAELNLEYTSTIATLIMIFTTLTAIVPSGENSHDGALFKRIIVTRKTIIAQIVYHVTYHMF